VVARLAPAKSRLSSSRACFEFPLITRVMGKPLIRIGC
jgi:hypothetical protein